MRTLTITTTMNNHDIEKTVPFPHGVERGHLTIDLLEDIEAEWGGTVEDYELIIQENNK